MKQSEILKMMNVCDFTWIHLGTENFCTNTHQFLRTWQMLQRDERSRRGWWLPPSRAGRITLCLHSQNGYGTPWTHTHTGTKRKTWVVLSVKAKRQTGDWCKWTYGVSNMTLHTHAIVLRQSVVFSMCKSEFCWNGKHHIFSFTHMFI